MHTRHLMGELGVRGDIALLATALLAPLEVPILEQQVRIAAGEKLTLTQDDVTMSGHAIEARVYARRRARPRRPR